MLVVTAFLAFFAWDSWQKTGEQTRLARQALLDQQISSAWQILALQTPAATGKQYALRTLVANVPILEGIDLSCRAMGGIDDENNCTSPTQLSRLSVEGKGPRFRKSIISRSSFAATDLARAHFANVELDSVNFSGTLTHNAEFVGGYIGDADFTDAKMGTTIFRDMEFGTANFTRVDLTGVMFSGQTRFGPAAEFNVSGATLCRQSTVGRVCFDGLEQLKAKLWFFRDNPPIFGANDAKGIEQILLSCDRESDHTTGLEVHKNCSPITVSDLSH